jgi:hypothetical protein
LGGNWSLIIASQAAVSFAKNCLGSDLSNLLGSVVVVQTIALKFDFSVDIVFSTNAPQSQVDSQIHKAEGNTDWLNKFSSSTFNDLGGTGSLTVGNVVGTLAPGETQNPSAGSPLSTSGASSIPWSMAFATVATIALVAAQ